MVKIALYNYDDSFQVTYIFLDIKTSIRKKIGSYKKEQERTKAITDEINISTISFYQSIYYILIKQYNEKKDLFL